VQYLRLSWVAVFMVKVYSVDYIRVSIKEINKRRLRAVVTVLF